MSTVKLVAIDVDGTLITPELEIPPETRAAIAAARSRGVQVAIVTGRMYKSAAAYARELGLDGTPLIAYNGGLVREFPSGRTTHHEPVPLETCKRLAAFCETRGYYIQAFVNDEAYVPDMGPLAQHYMHVARVQVTPVGSIFLWLNDPSTKLVIGGEPEELPRVQAEVQELLGTEVEVTHSVPKFLEVVKAGVSKGRTLEAVATQMGLQREEVMSIGDAPNDVTMLQWAGTSFAVGEAREDVRQAAKYVTEAGAGYAVAEALRRMGLA